MWSWLIQFAARAGIYILEKLRQRDAYKASPQGKRDEIHQAIAQAKPGPDRRVNVLLDDAIRDSSGRLPDVDRSSDSRGQDGNPS